MIRPLAAPRWLVLVGIVVLGAAVYALAIWPSRRFPLLHWDASFGIAMVLVVTGVWAFGWFHTARHELLPSRGLLRSLTDPLIVALLVALIVGIPGYHLLNAVLDRGPTRHLAYVVEGQNCSAGKRGTGAELRLRSNAPSQPSPVRVDVTRPICRNAVEGQEVILDVKPGFFGSAWVIGYIVAARR